MDHQAASQQDHISQVHGMTHLDVLPGPDVVRQEGVDRVSGVELVPPHVARRVPAGHLRHQAHYQAPVPAQPAARVRRRLEPCQEEQRRRRLFTPQVCLVRVLRWIRSNRRAGDSLGCPWSPRRHRRRQMWRRGVAG